MAISTQFGVLLPQVSASWVHDYAVGGRTIDASFVDATEPSKFKFKREPVASNFANIGVGVSALLPNRWQPFVNFRTIQGNENLVSYGGTAGLRVGFRVLYPGFGRFGRVRTARHPPSSRRDRS